MSVQGRGGGHCSAAQEVTCPPDPPQPRGFRSSATATPWVLFSIRPSVAAAQLLCGRSQSAETRDRPCHVVLGALQGLPKSSLGLRDPLVASPRFWCLASSPSPAGSTPVLAVLSAGPVLPQGLCTGCIRDFLYSCSCTRELFPLFLCSPPFPSPPHPSLPLPTFSLGL